MKKPQDLANAIALAAHYHGSQVDKGGEPYILHCIRVMEQMDTIEEKIVAICHDLLEDTKITYTSLAKEIHPLTYFVDLLSRPDDMDYFEYVERVISYEKSHPSMRTASKVKMADLRDNLNPLRQPSLGEKDLMRLQKYHRAYKMLREHREEVGL